MLSFKPHTLKIDNLQNFNLFKKVREKQRRSKCYQLKCYLVVEMARLMAYRLLPMFTGLNEELDTVRNLTGLIPL